jgi:Tfp pilus assembly protein PilN
MKAINLIPPEQRRGAGGIAGRTGGVAYVVLTGLVALVIVGVVYAVTVHEVAKRKTTLAEVTQEAAAVKEQIAALQPYVLFQTLSQARIQSVASLAAERFDWPRAMTQVALALPSNVTLSSLAGSATGGNALGGAVSGSTGASGLTAGASASSTTAAVPAGVTVNAPTLSLSACAQGSPSVGQDTVATVLTRFRALQDVSSATVAAYTDSGCHGVTFNLTVAYDNGYGIPTVGLDAAPNTTVGG